MKNLAKDLKFAKEKKLPLNKLRAKAWATFSIYIRLRDCDKYQKNGMFAPCFTCDSLFHFKELQAGHFIAGRTNAILFDEEGVHAQCMRCNIFLSGNPTEYWEKMLELYGKDKCLEISNRRHNTKKYTAKDYEELIEKYKLKIKEFEPK